MTATSATATEHGNVLLMLGPDDPDGDTVYRALTVDEATALAEELSDAVRVLARSRLEDLRDRARARAEAVSE